MFDRPRALAWRPECPNQKSLHQKSIPADRESSPGQSRLFASCRSTSCCTASFEFRSFEIVRITSPFGFAVGPCHAIQLAEKLHHFPGGHSVVDWQCWPKRIQFDDERPRLRRDVETVDRCRTAGWSQNRAQNSQGRGFASAVGAE